MTPRRQGRICIASAVWTEDAGALVAQERTRARVHLIFTALVSLPNAFDATRSKVALNAPPLNGVTTLKELDMDTRTEDRLQIGDLITSFIYRDLGDWELLRTLFHPDGEIVVAWFEGKFSEFVDRSIRMTESSVRSKHLMGTPCITFSGDRAIAETNAMLLGENTKLDLAFEAHNRFVDTIEKRDGVWKFVKRQSVYDMAYFAFPVGVVEIERDILAKYPREYAPLAYLLEKGGFPIGRVFPTRGSELERVLKVDAKNWLTA